MQYRKTIRFMKRLFRLFLCLALLSGTAACSDDEVSQNLIVINGGEFLLGEAVVLYLLGVPLLLFFRRSGLMEKLLHGAHPSPH